MSSNPHVQELADSLPADASPLRKVRAATFWRDGSEEFLKQCIAEAKAAGMPKKWIDMAMGTIPFDIFVWQEMLPTFSDAEQKLAMSSIMDRGEQTGDSTSD